MDLWNIITAQFADLNPIAYPCLWKDEDNEPVLITRKMEISRWDDDTLCLYVWSGPCASQLRSSGLISHEWETDEEFHVLYAKMENLPSIMRSGRPFKKRPHLAGSWIKKRQAILGHKLIPYRPIVESDLVERRLGQEVPELDSVTIT